MWKVPGRQSSLEVVEAEEATQKMVIVSHKLPAVEIKDRVVRTMLPLTSYPGSYRLTATGRKELDPAQRRIDENKVPTS